MVEFITVVFLAFMFIALYMFSFFIILTLKNHSKLFSYPKPNLNYPITIIIPAHNEEESIKETVEHAMQLNYPKNKLEVIIANNASSDSTLKIAKQLKKKYKNLKIIDTNTPGKANVLNLAIKQSKGELIAVVDSDSFPHPDSLKKLTGFFDDPQMGAVTSFVKIRNKENNFFARIQSLEYLLLGWNRKLLDFIDSVNVTNGPLSLYRKKYIEKVGGFDTKTVTEDIDITWNMMKHNYKTGMCLDANVTTIAPTKFKPWFAQRTRWGLGGLQALQKYRAMFFKKGMFGAFILPFISLSIILSIATFLFSSYLIIKSITTRVLITTYSLSANTDLFVFSEINLYPSVIIFYFIVLFTLSITYFWYILKTTKYEKKTNLKKLTNLLFYTLLYLSFYPIIWFVSIHRFIKKDYKW